MRIYSVLDHSFCFSCLSPLSLLFLSLTVLVNKMPITAIFLSQLSKCQGLWINPLCASVFFFFQHFNNWFARNDVIEIVVFIWNTQFTQQIWWQLKKWTHLFLPHFTKQYLKKKCPRLSRKRIILSLVTHWWPTDTCSFRLYSRH